MKKFILLLLLLILGGCSVPTPTFTLQEWIDSIEVSTEITENLVLPSEYEKEGKTAQAFWYSSDTNIMGHDGVVARKLQNQQITLTLTLIWDDETLDRDFTITVIGTGVEPFLDAALDSITLPQSSKTDIDLPVFIYYDTVRLSITWTSSNTEALSNQGNIGLIMNDTLLDLTASVTYLDTTREKTFSFTALTLTLEERVNAAFDSIDLPSSSSVNLNLPLYFDYGLSGTWESSHPDIIAVDGTISPTLSGQARVTLTIIIEEYRRTFEVIVSKNGHFFMDNTFTGNKEQVQVVENKLELMPDALSGTYTTDVITSLAFTEAVASWAATSSPQATVEVSIQVRVGSTWSKYFSYGEWGLGRQNKSYNSSDAIARLSADEVIVADSQQADAFRLLAVLKRNALSDVSPQLSLLAVALQIPDYQYPVDISSLPNQVDYDVPKLYQHVVPTIGGIICSPTSSTMLLKYKGHDFSNQATYEHQYIAGVVREYNSGIYGNWVYNTVGISAFGENSYVKRMYSYQELLHHLATVGPIAASVKGTLVGELVKTWTTSGHLIVVRGYRFEGNQLYILANDPNISPVYEEYKVENFMTFWRGVVYVVE
ncbi:MAG: C39 family peptidase [Bacilli bacterium]|nr:C39 family peptidase [Bacilli bacterium]